MEGCNRGHAGDRASGGATTADHRDQSIGGAKPHRSSTTPRRDCRTPGFTCKARLNDCSRSEHTSAPCLVQGLVVRPGHWTSTPAIHCSRLGTGAMNRMSRMAT